MINLYVNLGGSKVDTTIINFIYTACKNLGINNSAYDLHVDFHHQVDPGFYGFTDGDTTEANIEINACLPFEDMIKTLSHELIHAKQFLSGDLVNQTYKGVDCSNLHYLDKPFEIEAYDGESEIAALFNKTLR